MKAPVLYPWLTGTRPVAGAVGACSLMLLACSWFAIAPDRVGSDPDVGSRTPVRIGDSPQDAGRVAPARTVPAHRSDVSARRSSAAQTTPRRLITPGARTTRATTAEATPPSAPSRDATKPAGSAPAPQSAPARQSAPITPPTLPGPLDELPNVSVPVPPVTLPQLPQVPSVALPDPATTATPLGLP
jgi:hypothetical protein